MARLGEPDELAATAVYLAGDAASYVTGATVVVDGGYTLW
jgi:NAD(P)-dependent dehydrogenase (short-subunit alcohol dehydrogenase family)